MAVGGHSLAVIGEEDDPGDPACAWCEDFHRRTKVLPCVHTFRFPDFAAAESDSSKAYKDMPAGTESEDADPFVGISPSEIRRPRPYFCVWCEEMTRFVCEICEMPKAEMKKYQNQFFVDLSIAHHKSSVMSCSGHSCTTPAAFACCDCQMLLCPRCRQSHDTIPATGGHLMLRLCRRTTKSDLPDSVNPVTENLVRLKLGRKAETDRKAETTCPVHPENIMTLYCQPCKQLVCPLCQETPDNPHEDHVVVTVEAAAEEGRARASKLLKELNGALKVQMEELEGLERKEEGLSRRRKHYMDEGAKVVSRITTSLHAAVGKMTRRINEVETAVLSQIHSKKIAVRLHHSTLVKLQGQLIHALDIEDPRLALELVPGLESRATSYLADQTKQQQESAGGGSRVDPVVTFEKELRAQLKTLEQALQTVAGLFFYETGHIEPL